MTQTTGSHRLELDTDYSNGTYRALCSCGWTSRAYSTDPSDAYYSVSPGECETAAIEAGSEHVADQC